MHARRCIVCSIVSFTSRHVVTQQPPARHPRWSTCQQPCVDPLATWRERNTKLWKRTLALVKIPPQVITQGRIDHAAPRSLMPGKISKTSKDRAKPLTTCTPLCADHCQTRTLSHIVKHPRAPVGTQRSMALWRTAKLRQRQLADQNPGQVAEGHRAHRTDA